MPEGDTVWLAGRRLHDALAGAPLTRTDFRVPRLATADLAGRVVAEVVSCGKHLLARIEPDLTLHSHLRMDGAWHLYRRGDRWRGGPAWQVRAVLETEDWQAVGYRLPVLELLPRSGEADAVGHLGPDLLGPDWDATEAVRRLAADPTREVGPALLDQRNLAGIGNMYAAELCFLSGVRPTAAVACVTDLAGLAQRARQLLEANKERPAQTTTGDLRPGRRLWVYGRAGEPCLRCGTLIRRADVGRRVAFYCPNCQRDH